MKLTKKLTALGLAVAMVASIGATSVFASEELDNNFSSNQFDSNINQYLNVGELDPTMELNENARFLKDYIDLCHKEFIRHSTTGMPIGATGWTQILNKSDSSDRFHYSNIVVITDSSGNNSQQYESGRKWGKGKVPVSVVTNSFVNDCKIYYGW